MVKTTLATSTEADERYADLERLVRDRAAGPVGPLFETDVDPEAMWAAYLGGIPADRRQHYTCNSCRRFVQRYGGLVTISGEGVAYPLFWNNLDFSDFFLRAVVEMNKLAAGAKVTGPFLSSEIVWGTPVTGAGTVKKWTHLHAPNPSPYSGKVLTAEQRMAELKQDYGVLCHSLADYPRAAVSEATRVLGADALYRSEKAEAVAKWALDLHDRVANVKGRRRDNLLWLATATAPVGFTHLRSTVVSTLLDDIVAGVPFATLSRRWAEKLHPLQYQRPTAAPSAGAIDAAEKLFEKLGLAPALKRRYATLDDVLAKVWTPKAVAPTEVKPGGVFDALRGTPKGEVRRVDLPPRAVSWRKFSEDILPGALSVETRVPWSGGFYGLLTAADPEASPILQWDHPDARNPVSWYFHSNGSAASRWGLAGNSWAKVTAVFLPPYEWGPRAAYYIGQHDHVFFAVEGCRESNPVGLCLFPEILKSELHGVRSVVEAFSNKGRAEGAELGTANGLAFGKSEKTFHPLRVTTAAGADEYTLDRWE